jgi:hypothetical protein
MPSVTLAVAPLYEISLDASVTELTISDPAMLVLGLRQENPQPAAPPPLQIPFAPAAFCAATLAAFLTILLAASASLRPTRQVTELIRPMA